MQQLWGGAGNWGTRSQRCWAESSLCLRQPLPNHKLGKRLQLRLSRLEGQNQQRERDHNCLRLAKSALLGEDRAN